MRITFNGTLDQLTETIRQKARESQKDIVVYHTDPDVLEIGFCRLGYNAGRFFIANITQENGAVTLNGEIKNVYHNSSGNRTSEFQQWLSAFVIGYIFLEIPLIILWLFLRRFVSIWIPLALPLIYIAIRPIFNKKENEKLDKSFIDFMSSFSTVV